MLPQSLHEPFYRSMSICENGAHRESSPCAISLRNKERSCLVQCTSKGLEQSLNLLFSQSSLPLSRSPSHQGNQSQTMSMMQLIAVLCSCSQRGPLLGRRNPNFADSSMMNPTRSPGSLLTRRATSALSLLYTRMVGTCMPVSTLTNDSDAEC